VGGSEPAVRTLQRMDQLLAEPAGAELDESMFDRSRAYGNPLIQLCSHLTARWPGHPPHRSALGTLALSTLDGDALHAFASGRVARPIRPAS
jgi:hypothetical protein